MLKLNFARIIGAGIIFAILSQIIHTLGSIPTMSFFMDPTYYPVWSKIMMPTEGPPPPSFFYAAIIFAIINGILLALVYAIIRGGIPGKGVKRGVVYGFLIFLVAGVPGALMLYLLINLPSALIAYWALENLIIALIGGTIFGKLIV